MTLDNTADCDAGLKHPHKEGCTFLSSVEMPCTCGAEERAQSVIVINVIEPKETRAPRHPCEEGRHRWAYLVGGGQACGYCGRPR